MEAVNEMKESDIPSLVRRSN